MLKNTKNVDTLPTYTHKTNRKNLTLNVKNTKIDTNNNTNNTIWNMATTKNTLQKTQIK